MGKITHMVLRFGPEPKPKPKAGDRKVVKGVEYVRRQARSRDGYHVRNGKPVWEWVKVKEQT